MNDAGLVPLMDGEVEINRSFWLVTHAELRGLPRIEAVAAWLAGKVASFVHHSAARGQASDADKP